MVKRNVPVAQQRTWHSWLAKLQLRVECSTWKSNQAGGVSHKDGEEGRKRQLLTIAGKIDWRTPQKAAKCDRKSWRKMESKQFVYSNQIDTVLGGKLLVDASFFLWVSVMYEYENINKRRQSVAFVQTAIKILFVDSPLLRLIHQLKTENSKYTEIFLYLAHHRPHVTELRNLFGWYFLSLRRLHEVMFII